MKNKILSLLIILIFGYSAQLSAQWNGGIPTTNPTSREGAVGVGITATLPLNPNTQLHVISSTVHPGSVLFEGAIGTTPMSGYGTRLMWVPSKAAFRAGQIFNNQWDDGNIGIGSFAMGQDNIASGDNSSSMGLGNSSTGDGSTTVGRFNSATGIGAFCGGVNSSATKDFSFAFGTNTNAKGKTSVAFGSGNNSEGDGSFTIGGSNTAYGTNSFAGGEGSSTGSSGFGSDNSMAFGNFASASGGNSFALGVHAVATNSGYAIGNNVRASGANSFCLGAGIVIPGGGSSSDLTNPYDSSFAVGFMSNVPTLFVEKSVKPNTPDYWGKVGIGTTAPRAFLDVNFALRNGEWNNNGYWNAIFDASHGCYDNVRIDMGENCDWSTALGVNHGGMRTTNLYSNGQNWAMGSWWSSSDRSFKSNIKEIENPLDVIKSLVGKSYDFKHIPTAEAIPSYGFIAQDVKEVLPNLVRKFENDKYAVNYDGFIPILTEAIKEQQKQIDSKDQQIVDLQEELKDLRKTVNQIKNDISTICDKGCAGLNGSGNDPSETKEVPVYLRTAWLGQNFPNPHSGKTSIKYYVPIEAKNAELRVVDLQGKLISKHVLDISAGSVELEDINLTNGMYLYSLIVDRVQIDSKRMAIEK